ncbi:hypothetical protein GDO81_015751 [Engystomops pustulosus]|uniref:Uncharacterized protein n=1 Tax=Engystomops pustulosus TaxID=76066 RepID=A0AAV7AWX1_ENGPU|nr:hypothetical protein GDO81_015751 [Engystomops pustulosus]
MHRSELGTFHTRAFDVQNLHWTLTHCKKCVFSDLHSFHTHKRFLLLQVTCVKNPRYKSMEMHQKSIAL